MHPAFRRVGFWSQLFLEVRFFHFQSEEGRDGWGSGWRGWNRPFAPSILQEVNGPDSVPWYAFYLQLDCLADGDPL